MVGRRMVGASHERKRSYAEPEEKQGPADRNDDDPRLIGREGVKSKNRGPSAGSVSGSARRKTLHAEIEEETVHHARIARRKPRQDRSRGRETHESRASKTESQSGIKDVVRG